MDVCVGRSVYVYRYVYVGVYICIYTYVCVCVSMYIACVRACMDVCRYTFPAWPPQYNEDLLLSKEHDLAEAEGHSRTGASVVAAERNVPSQTLTVLHPKELNLRGVA